MDSKIDLILPNIRQFCREGYLLPKERQTLYDLADCSGIARGELEDCIKLELKKANDGKLEMLYQVSTQPDAAIADSPDLFPQSRRQFPEVLKVGKLSLLLNGNVKAPAFVPVRNGCGVCVMHNDAEKACNIIQNMIVRIMLSLPRALTHVTVIDPVGMGSDFIDISGIDKRMLTLIDDKKQVESFLKECNRDMASFNFNELGTKYADLAEYNRNNRSKAHPYQLIVLPDYPNGWEKNDVEALLQIKQNLAQRTGRFFLIVPNAAQLKKTPDVLDFIMPNLCCIDLRNKVAKVSSRESMELFNNGFRLAVDDNLEFTAQTLLALNHEFDPAMYPMTTDDEDSGNDCIESLNLTYGKTEAKGKTFGIALQKENDHVLVCSSDDAYLEATELALLQGMANYKHAAVNYIFYNCQRMGTCCGDNVIANIQSGKLLYAQGLLKRLKHEMEQRRQMFADAMVPDYAAFRNVHDEMMPRIVCVMDSIETILDSVSMRSIEVLSDMDELLRESGKYGIHFIMTAHPTLNLLKVNVKEHINNKVLHGLSIEEVAQTGVIITDADADYLLKPNCGIVSNGMSYIKVQIDGMNQDMLKEVTKAMSSEREVMSAPILFIDKDEAYPAAYRTADSLALGENDGKVSIGYPRYYATGFASINLQGGHLMVAGNDHEAVMSLLKSIYNATKNRNALSVYDASGKNPIGLPGLPGVALHGSLDVVPIPENGVVCLLNMESFNEANSGQFDAFMVRVNANHAKVILFATEDVSAKLGMSQSLFDERLALCGAPDGFVSPIHFITDEDIALPKAALEALMELPNDMSGTEAKSIWLFKY